MINFWFLVKACRVFPYFTTYFPWTNLLLATTEFFKIGKTIG